MTRRLVHIEDARERRIVLLTLSPCGAVVAAAVPATNWHAWSPAERAFAARVGEVSGALRRGRSLRALAAHYEAMLSLVEQLEAAEALAGTPAEGRA
jgi:hypothetical protein